MGDILEGNLKVKFKFLKTDMQEVPQALCLVPPPSNIFLEMDMDMLLAVH